MSASELHERLLKVCRAFGRDDDEITSALTQTLVRVIVEDAPIGLLAQAKIEVVAQVMRDAVHLDASPLQVTRSIDREPPRPPRRRA
jgi:hypothetical protein